MRRRAEHRSPVRRAVHRHRYGNARALSLPLALPSGWRFQRRARRRVAGDYACPDLLATLERDVNCGEDALPPAAFLRELGVVSQGRTHESTRDRAESETPFARNRRGESSRLLELLAS